MKVGKVFGKAKVVKTSHAAKNPAKEPVKQVNYGIKVVFSDTESIKSSTKVERQSDWNFPQ